MSFPPRTCTMRWRCIQVSPRRVLVQGCAHVAGLASTASSMDEINSAYKQLARKYHPDRNKTPEAKEMMQTINEVCLLT